MKTKKIPSRICVGCREPKEKKSMVRIVKTAENVICLDETGKMNGDTIKRIGAFFENRDTGRRYEFIERGDECG